MTIPTLSPPVAEAFETMLSVPARGADTWMAGTSPAMTSQEQIVALHADPLSMFHVK
jgi:hypothetical protein